MTPRTSRRFCFEPFNLLLSIVLLVGASFAQSLSSPVCEPRPEIRKALSELPEYRSDPALTDWQVYQKRLAILKSLAAQYPNDVFVLRKYIESTASLRGFDKISVEEKSKTDAEFKAGYEHNPDDPHAEFLYGLTLVGRDTPRAIKLFEEALQGDPSFALPHLYLVGLYSADAFRDKEKALSNAKAFLDACPASFEGYEPLGLWIAGNDLLTKYAAQLRGILQNRLDEDDIGAYRILWSMEFKAHPASQYDALRKQVADDVARIRQLNLENSRAWYDTLERGYKLADNQKEADWVRDQRSKHFASIAAMQDREKWFKDHPSPSEDSPSAREVYYRDLLAQTTQWLKQLPPDAILAHFSVLGDRVRAMSQLDHIPAADLETAVEERLKFAGENGGASSWSTELSPWSGDYDEAAETLSKKHLAPERVVEYAQKALVIEEFESKQPPFDLFATKDNVNDQKFYAKFSQTQLLQYEIGGYLQLKQADKAEPLLARMDQQLQEMKSLAADKDDKKEAYARRLADYWGLRAQAAEVRGQKMDAMSFYQSALLIRLDAKIKPSSDEKDELAEDAHRLWLSLQGTEGAWQLWYGRRANDLASANALNWEKANQPLAAFELTDLNNHTWNLSSLKGKTTLISFWATWCGPCREELPRLRKLIEHYKDRADVQFISLNMDDNPGLIQPFMKEHELSMTVIPAFSFISDTLKVNGIPQNWIVDPQGTVRRKSVGYDSTEKWMSGMEGAIEEAKSAPAAPSTAGSSR